MGVHARGAGAYPGGSCRWRTTRETYAERLAERGWHLSLDGNELSAAQLRRWTPSEEGALCVSAALHGCRLIIWS